MDEIFIFLWASCICVWYIWKAVFWYVLHSDGIARQKSVGCARSPFFSSLHSALFSPEILDDSSLSLSQLCFHFIISRLDKKKRTSCKRIAERDGIKNENFNENISGTLSGIQCAFKSIIIHVNNNHNLWWDLHTSHGRVVDKTNEKREKTAASTKHTHKMRFKSLRLQPTRSAMIEIYRD